MKKSELAAKIDNFLATKEDFNGEIASYKGLGLELLEFLEKEGMVPAAKEDLAHRHYHGGDHDYEPIMIYEWDKE